MYGQGKTTKQIVRLLEENEWNVLFYCIPNTPHFNVIPITTKSGSSKQRYPDIVAFKGDYTRFIEVEITLNEKVADDILERFSEFISSLKSNEYWRIWRNHVLNRTGKSLPPIFNPICDLVICHELSDISDNTIERLHKSGIIVSSLSTFSI